MQLRLLSRLLNPQIPIPATNLVLRAPAIGDFEQWQKLRNESKLFLTPWEPRWPSDDLTKVGFQRRLRAYTKQRQSGWGRTYFLFDNQNDTLLGGISLTHITYGISRSANLGYWMGVHHAGKGYMKKTVPAILEYAFNDLGLNRIQAGCLPSNERSIHLLKSCGFLEEGYAREYLEINGTPEDHVIFAAVKADHQQH